FNASINNMDKKIEFRQGDMFQPIEGMLFDLIAVNPPLQTSKKTWASGKTLTEYILKNADKHLSLHGSLQIICYMPDEARYLLDSLKERFRKVKVVRPRNKPKNKLGVRSDKGRSSKDKYEYMNYLFIHASGKKPNP
ncbi:MAG: methyltransferase, partial [Thermodesulfobacteriota bacterium]